jgi:hypothetical protein
MNPKIVRVTCLLAAAWCAVAVPAFAIQSKVSAVHYVDGDGDRRIFAFARGDNGHLVLNHFDGTSWQWIDHGLPAGATSIGRPQAITYVDASGNRRIYVFARNNSNRLVLRYFNGFQWQWVSQGGPALGNSLSVITYVDSSGNRRIYAFSTESDQHHLVTNYWNGSTWQWADQGTWPGTTVSVTDAITYLDDNGQRRIDVFCISSASQGAPLLANSWDGSSWNWVNHGGSQVGDASAVTYVDSSGNRRVYVFADRNNTLYARQWDGFSWQWANLGIPAGQQNSIFYTVSAITYQDTAGNRRLYAFTEFSNDLFAKHWNGFSWSWANQGLPAGLTGIQSPSALTFVDARGGTQRIYVFAMGSNGHLVMNYWNGATWQWYDNGTM